VYDIVQRTTLETVYRDWRMPHKIC